MLMVGGAFLFGCGIDLDWWWVGCNEIIFNPLVRWFRQGPISKQLRTFVWSKAPIHYKIGMMACKSLLLAHPPHTLINLDVPSSRHVLILCVNTSFPLTSVLMMRSIDGIAAATLGGVLNYLLLGIGPQIDRYYLHSFEILLACTVVFPGIGNVGFTLLEYRLGQRNFFAALIENLRWIPFLCVNFPSPFQAPFSSWVLFRCSLFFFGGLSIHLSTAILAHLFSYNM